MKEEEKDNKPWNKDFDQEAWQKYLKKVRKGGPKTWNAIKSSGQVERSKNEEEVKEEENLNELSKATLERARDGFNKKGGAPFTKGSKFVPWMKTQERLAGYYMPKKNEKREGGSITGKSEPYKMEEKNEAEDVLNEIGDTPKGQDRLRRSKDRTADRISNEKQKSYKELDKGIYPSNLGKISKLERNKARAENRLREEEKIPLPTEYGQDYSVREIYKAKE